MAIPTVKCPRVVGRIWRWLRRRWRDRRARDRVLADQLVGRADAYRDDRRFGEAGVLYAEALRLDPARSPIHIQAGHMFKEAGDFARAADHYAAARAAQPDDADLLLQLGHFRRIVGDSDGAAGHYRDAARLRPDWPEPRAALTSLGRTKPVAIISTAPVPELLPTSLVPSFAADDAVELLRYAQRRERSPWGLMPTLRGIEAVRGYCIARAPLTGVELLVDGTVVGRGAVRPFALDGGRTKYVFNLWHNFSAVPEGPHDVAIRLVGGDGTRRERRDTLLVRPAPAEADHLSSDAIVAPEAGGDGNLDERIRRRPSMIRPALRGECWPVPERVLVVRTDQLGDLVVSVPAIRRLRALLPDARIVGLLTDANAGIARRLALFDEVVVATFPDEGDKGGRSMTAADQETLRAALHARRFDLAIDLSTSGMSRPLLLLTGATRTLGFSGEGWPWLSSELGGMTPDARNRLEAAPHGSKLHSLVDRLAMLIDSGAVVEPLPEGDRTALDAFPALTGRRYAVLHTGGRLVFSRWHGYPALARRLIDELGLAVVLLTEDPDLAAGLHPDLLADARFTLAASRLEPAAFDALLGFADLVVANDSGPKHLAALRGAPVVSIHSARINWSEWGQEQTGFIVSRRVPCAGCAIHHDVENCGKDYACIADIGVDEVMAAVRLALPVP